MSAQPHKRVFIDAAKPNPDGNGSIVTITGGTEVEVSASVSDIMMGLRLRDQGEFGKGVIQSIEEAAGLPIHSLK